MSSLVRGVQIYRCIPPPNQAGITVDVLMEAIGVSRRTVERDLVVFERAGLVRREHGRKPDAKELAEIGRRSWIVNDAKIHARDAKVHSHSPGPTAG